MTLIISMGILLIPTQILQITTTNVSVVQDSVQLMPLLFVILLCIAFSNIFYNGIVGSGAIGISLLLQIVAVIAYVGYAYYVMEVMHYPLWVGWCAELVYFMLIFIGAILYMRGTRWHDVSI